VSGYYRRFIEGYSNIAKPLTDLTKKGVGNIQEAWTDEHTRAFETLRTALTSSPILIRPDVTKPFMLTTDWNPGYIAGILSQKLEDGRERVIAYGSKKLSGAETRWSATEVECFAVVYFTKMWHQYLSSSKFTFGHRPPRAQIHNDGKRHKCKVARWATNLWQYDFVVVHKPGRKNTNADA